MRGSDSQARLPAMRARRFLPVALAAAAAVAACGPAPRPAAPPGPARLRVLFIGNSLTYANDLPGQLERLARAAGAPLVETAAVTRGGASLQDHWEGEAARAAITRGGWTHVLLQAQTFEPFSSPAAFRDAAGRLAAAARTAGAQPVLLETWAPDARHPVYSQEWARGGPEVMQRALARAYRVVGEASGARVAPVGEAMFAARTVRPGLELLAADGGHPAPAGTYLAACVLYLQLAGRALPAAGAPPTLAPDDAAFLRAQAAAAIPGGAAAASAPR